MTFPTEDFLKQCRQAKDKASSYITRDSFVRWGGQYLWFGTLSGKFVNIEPKALRPTKELSTSCL